MIKIRLISLDLHECHLHFDTDYIVLSETEAEALMMLMQNKNVPISRSEITVKFFS